MLYVIRRKIKLADNFSKKYVYYSEFYHSFFGDEDCISTAIENKDHIRYCYGSVKKDGLVCTDEKENEPDK